MKKALIYTVLGLLSLTACQDEDPITPSGNYSVLRFDFPQGNNDFDMDIKEIHDIYGVYLLYKDITLADINRRWTSLGTGNLYNGDPVPDECMPFYVNFFKNHIFANITPEIAGNALPVKIYMFENYGIYNPEETGSGSGSGNLTVAGTTTPNTTAVTTVTNGFDYWAVCFKRDVIDQNDKESLHVARCSFLYQMIKKNWEAGLIKEPESIRDKLDFATPFEYTEGSPNNRATRGFPNFIYDNFLGSVNPYAPAEDPSVNYAVSETKNPGTNKYYFLLYLRTAMFFSHDELMAKYSSAPKIIELYDELVEYMKNSYGIDLARICNGPEE